MTRITRFNTETGSRYEVDHEKKQIRRLEGTHAPTPRQGEDGNWKPYYEVSEIALRKRVTILWDDEGRATITSEVVVLSEE